MQKAPAARTDAANPADVTHDPLVQVDKKKLFGLIAGRTPFTMPQFEQLIGWSFLHGDAPASKRELAWKILRLKKQDIELLYKWSRLWPTMWISKVEDVDAILAGSRSVVPARHPGKS